MIGMKREIIPVAIAQSIFLIRGQKVMLSQDLAALYGVAVKVLNQAVKRHTARFPADFVFQLTPGEFDNLKSQFVTSRQRVSPRSRSQTVTLKRGQNIKYLPYAFTEEGVAMLSSVLKSDRAVKVNIAIMRAFVRLRETIETNRELARKFAELEKRVGKHDAEIGAVIDAIRQLMAPPEKPRREIGFHVREKVPRYRSRNHR